MTIIVSNLDGPPACSTETCERDALTGGGSCLDCDVCEPHFLASLG